jgi:hypothetical protein
MQLLLEVMWEVNYVVKQIQMAMNVHHDKELFLAKNYREKKSFQSISFILLTCPY